MTFRITPNQKDDNLEATKSTFEAGSFVEALVKSRNGIFAEEDADVRLRYILLEDNSLPTRLAEEKDSEKAKVS